MPSVQCLSAVPVNDDRSTGVVSIDIRITGIPPVVESELGPLCEALIIKFAFSRDHEPQFCIRVPKGVSDGEAHLVVQIFQKYYVNKASALERIRHMTQTTWSYG